MKKQYALIGKTLSYSHSPLIHNTLFKALGAEAEYGLLELSPESLAAGLECVRAEYCGCNVTVPYKQAVIPFLDEISGEAAAVGAVNTIVNQNGRLSGLNTDGEGFMRSLPVSAEELKGKRVLVCGAGGAARVIVYRLLKAGAYVEIQNRTAENAERLLHELSAHVQAENGRYTARAGGSYFLCVNTTPVGMLSLQGSSPISAEQAARCEYVYDCVYNPAQTKLLRDAQAAGCKCAGGFGMLWHQAVLAQEHWGYVYTEMMLKAAQEHVWQAVFGHEI